MRSRTEPPSRAEPEGLFFPDDADRKLIAKRRGEDNRLGFAPQVTTGRFVGRFLPDPPDVPVEAVDERLADEVPGAAVLARLHGGPRGPQGEQSTYAALCAALVHRSARPRRGSGSTRAGAGRS